MPSVTRMHQKPRRTLATILKRHGAELIDDPRRTQALLNDLCGRYTREIFVIVQAQRLRVPGELRAAPRWMPLNSTISRLTQHLQDQLALMPEASAWAVETWAIALELRSENSPDPWYQRWPAALWQKEESTATGTGAPATSDTKPATSSAPAAHTAPLPKTAASATAADPASSHAKDIQSAASNGARQNVANSVQSKANRTWGHRFSLQRTPNATPSKATTNGKVARLPVYLRRQAPSVLLWTTVFLISLTLGWAFWNGTPVALEPVTPAAPPGATAPAVNAGTLAPTTSPTASTPVPGFALLNALYAPPQIATVTALDGLRVRAAPSLDALNIDLLAYRQTVTIAEYSPDGLWARLAGPQSGAPVGWASTQYLAFASPVADAVQIRLGVARITTQLGPVTLHSAPRVDAAALDQLAPGATVIVVASTANADWYQIGEPALGWVRATAVEFETAGFETETDGDGAPDAPAPLEPPDPSAVGYHTLDPAIPSSAALATVD